MKNVKNNIFKFKKCYLSLFKFNYFPYSKLVTNNFSHEVFSALSNQFKYSLTENNMENVPYLISIKAFENNSNNSINKLNTVELKGELSSSHDSSKDINSNNNTLVVPKAEFLNKRYSIALKKRKKRKTKKQISLRWR